MKPCKGYAIYPRHYFSISHPNVFSFLSSLNEFSEEEKGALVASCPRGVFDYDDTAETVRVSRPADCIFCKECLFLLEDFRRRPEDPLAVSVTHCYERFTFTVETTGSLKAKDVVRSALQELTAKINRLKTSVHQLDGVVA
jgi:NAD-dependent dihydropyrimidine dehydrogenase PreA subunit